MTDRQPSVQVRNIGKSFGATRALDDVSFDFFPGEIFGLVGANGAGKSTLIKIICGYYPDYEGEVLIDGKAVHCSSPHDALNFGIATVHQIINQGVIPDMTVAENLALADLLSKNGSLFCNREKIAETARIISEPMDLQHLDMNQMVADLSQSDRQMIAIARALASKPRLLILDEPTSSISEREADVLFDKLAKLRADGVSILYVSHRLHEIERIADRVGVIRDGTYGCVLEKPFNVKQIVTAMVGELDHVDDRLPPIPAANEVPKIELRNLVVQAGDAPLNLKIYTGEIVGMTGLIGAGKTELANVLFGVARPVAGDILIDGVAVDIASVNQAIDTGIYMVPEDRMNNAIIPDFNIRENITMPFLDRFSGFLGLMRGRQESREAKRMIGEIGVKCSGELSRIDELSGGNQQKVVVSRWLMTTFNLLILDEPYQGVDIRSRHDINVYIRSHCADGALLVMAADLDEILEVADRVVVMNSGMIVGEQVIGEIERSTLLHWTAQSSDELRKTR